MTLLEIDNGEYCTFGYHFMIHLCDFLNLGGRRYTLCKKSDRFKVMIMLHQYDLRPLTHGSTSSHPRFYLSLFCYQWWLHPTQIRWSVNRVHLMIVCLHKLFFCLFLELVNIFASFYFFLFTMHLLFLYIHLLKKYHYIFNFYPLKRYLHTVIFTVKITKL
jgi:hypothetical protein